MATTKKRKIHNNSKRTVRRATCSPVNPEKNKDYTCYDDEHLEKFKNLWNARHADDKIIYTDPHKIWESLRKRFSGVCDSEKCWMRQLFVAGNLSYDITKYTFAPDAPKSWRNNPTEWLTSTDIINVMKHFENAFNDYVFIGPSPIDFDKQLMYGDCVWEELCKFDLKKMLSKRKKKIGIIFNTDPHTKDGEHWVSMFIDMTASPQPFVFYFDSNGDPVIDEIKVFADRIIEQGAKMDKTIKFYQNHPKEHQKGDTECGIYCLYMITELLSGRKKYNFFLEKTVTDEEMEQFRRVYFDHSSIS